MESMLISICIPVYEIKDVGEIYLKQLLQTIEAQNYKEYEVVISDHSENNKLKNIVDSFNNSKFFHYFNSNNRGSSSENLNNAIDKANSENIKVMFQDDFFVSRDALNLLVESFSNSFWGAYASIHYKDKKFYSPLYPYWQDNIKTGYNTIGCPSSIYFRKNDLKFDSELLWYMDTDYYYRLFLKYGPPAIKNDVIVGIRVSDNSVTKTLITNELIEKENKIISTKY
jgi:glycosyltransferase involved in cell wall biosynthesis